MGVFYEPGRIKIMVPLTYWCNYGASDEESGILL